ncbi:5-methyltetrahydrofolate--homocysteine methyltransferase (EC [Olavius algarvensis Delta 1 endosymbiont]|nr:5-methyltetrahydrofolate--homocysteine methyltransferase (EC [Olavius algarvensis Delta 1 endosymbiont]
MNILEKLKKKTILFDGAIGTMLMESGHVAAHSPIRLNLEQPDLVADLHKQYYDAGAEVVVANTFGGNPIKLAAEGLEQKLEVLNREGVRLAQAVCPAGRFVAGDMGPCGKMLKPLGDVAPEDLQDNFFKQASILIDAGVDLIAVETMYSLEEALLAVNGVRQAGDILLLVSMTFNQNPNGFFTMMGENIARCTAALEEAGVDMIGANCTLNSADIIRLTTELRASTAKPILIQPNAGQPVTVKGVTRYEQTPADFAADAVKIKRAGADMIGGCCGTRPEFISEVAAALARGETAA